MKKSILLALLLILRFSEASANPTSLLTPDRPITLQGLAGHFDYMATDTTLSRVLAAHRDAKTLEIIDLKTGQPLKAIEVGHAQGIAVDSHGHKYFLGNESEQSIVILDSQKLTKMGEVKVDGPVDAIAFDDKNAMLFAGKDDGDYLWVIDTTASKLAGKVSIPGIPEGLEYDSKTDRVYLNIKNKDSVVRIDPAKNKVDAT